MTDAIDAYLSSVSALWPGEPEPRSLRGRGSGVPGELSLLVIPHARRPRLLVPADRPDASARAMLRFSAALSARDVAQRLAVAALLRGRVTAAFPDRIAVADRPGSLRHHLADVLGEPVDVSLGLGTARANRKPVLEVFDRRGRSLAFVKVGGTDSTDDLVRTEAAALARLAEGRLPATLEVPRVLHAGTWRGAALLVMSSLATSFRQRPRHQLTVPVHAMRGLHAAFDEGALPLAATPLWQEAAATAAALDGEGADRFRAALAALADRAGDLEVRAGAWHGDWTPWNMSRAQGRLQVWDWERFATGAPEGLDRFHYGVNALTRRDGLSTDSVLAGLALAGAPGPDERGAPADLGHAVAAAYLAAVTARYLGAAAADPTDTVHARGLVLLDALHRWLDQREGTRHA